MSLQGYYFLVLIFFSGVLFEIEVKAVSRIEILQHLDFTTLDWFDPDLIHFGFELIDDDLEIVHEIALKGQKVCFEKEERHHEGNTLRILEYPKKRPLLSNHFRLHYVKNPNETFMYLVGNKSLLDLDLKLFKQPYYFAIANEGDLQELLEVQTYSSLIQKLMVWSTSMKQVFKAMTSDSMFARRSNFNRARIWTSHEPVMPWFGRNANRRWIGINGVLLNTVKSHFNFSVRFSRFNDYGFLKNGTWTGAVKDMMENKMDFAPYGFSQTYDRSSAIKAGYNYKTSRTIIVYKKYPTNHYSFFSLVDVFHPSFWTCWIIMIMLFLTLFGLAFYGKDSGFTHALALVGKSIIIQSNDIEVFNSKKWKTCLRIQVLVMSLFGGMVYWTYSSCLTSYLAVPKGAPPISSMEDLSIRSDFKLYIYKGAPIHNYIMEKALIHKETKRIYDQFVKKNLFKTKDIARVTEEIAKNDNAAAILDETLIFGALAKRVFLPDFDPCDYNWKDFREIPGFPIGWMYPKDSILSILFDDFMYELDEMGILDKIRDDYLSIDPRLKTTQCNASLNVRVNYPLVGIVFVILCIGIGLSIIIAFCEKIFIR